MQCVCTGQCVVTIIADTHVCIHVCVCACMCACVRIRLAFCVENKKVQERCFLLWPVVANDSSSLVMLAREILQYLNVCTANCFDLYS